MNSRERVMAVLRHELPDRVPVDLGSTAVSSIHRRANDALKVLLGIEAEEPVHDVVQGLVVPDERTLQRFGVDFRRVALRPSSTEAAASPTEGEDTYLDEWGMRRQRTELYWEIVEHPLADARVEDLRHYPWPDPHDPCRVAGLAEEARRLYEETDYALVADFLGGGIFEQALWMRGFERFMMDLVSDEPFATALLDILLELYIEFYAVYLEAVGPYVQIVALGDDLGMQTGPLISPELYRRLIKPRHKELYDFIHSRTEAKIMHHTCGSVFPFVQDLIDVGVDILNPIQTSARGMDPAALKREFGERLVFHGGIDVQQILPFATPERVREEVKHIVATLGQGGGYIFAPSHNIQADVPPENVLAMYEAIQD
ncbi:MAG: uroporphyrinogen decarboxylase family protein [Anaerolineae bacterium]